VAKKPNPEDAFDPAKQDEFEAALKKLPPEEAAFLLWKLSQALRRRKIQLTGYLVAIALWLVSMIGALVIFGMSEGFVGYVFVIPFALVGGCLWAFGKWADRISKQEPPKEITVKG